MKPSHALAVLLIGSLGLSARADEEKIPPGKLPAAVKKSVKARFPKAKITSAAKEVEEGETVYEVSLTFEGDAYDLSVEPDGTLAEVEREIESEDLPKRVVAALKAKYPKAKITKAEELIKDNILSYEVVLARGKKEPFEVAVSRSGMIAKAKAEGDDEDEEAVKSKKGEEDEDDEKEMKAKSGKKSQKVAKADDDDEDEKKVVKSKKSKEGGDKDEDEDEKDD